MKYTHPSFIASALLSAGLACVGMLATTSASAQTPHNSPSQPQAIQQQLRLSLSEAIDAAEAAVPGRAIDAQLESENGLLHYEIEIITPQDSHVEVLVNASTGTAVLHKTRGPASAKDKQRLETSKITLKQALDAALRHTPGTPLEADLDQHRGRTIYKVDVRNAAGQRLEIKLDAENGNVLSTKVD